MFSPFLLLTALLPFTTAQYSTPPNSHTKDPALVAKLKTAATYYDRQLLLDKDTDWYYDASKHENFHKPGGAVITVDVSQMAALEGAGVSIAVLKMGPCGMLPVHEHPRAGNVVTGITGNVTSWMIGDNGSRVVTVNILPFIVTYFPQGTVHVMQNNDCKEALLISSLSSDDSGTNNVLRSFSQVPPEIMLASFGAKPGADYIDVRAYKARVPEVGTGVIRGSAECLKRCGMKP